jgi:hypothetical protein
MSDFLPQLLQCTETFHVDLLSMAGGSQFNHLKLKQEVIRDGVIEGRGSG